MSEIIVVIQIIIFLFLITVGFNFYNYKNQIITKIQFQKRIFLNAILLNIVLMIYLIKNYF